MFIISEMNCLFIYLFLEGSKSWREVVDERVEKKTRRFGSGVCNKVIPQKNRFAEFASGFLRPLLAIYQHREHLDLQVSHDISDVDEWQKMEGRSTEGAVRTGHSFIDGSIRAFLPLFF